MQEKMKTVAVVMDEQGALQSTVIRLGEMGMVTGGMIDGAPALIFHKELDPDSSTFGEDFQNPANMVIVRFGNPQEVETLLSAIDRALKPFVEKDVEFDIIAPPSKQTLN